MVRRFGLLAIAALTLLLGACSAMSRCLGGGASADVSAISVSEVASLLEKKDAVFIFDANTPDRYRQGHVPTAKWVPYDGVTKQHLPLKQDAKLVFYCFNEQCSASGMAAKQAVNLGYTNVRVMEAGIMGWEKAKQKLEG